MENAALEDVEIVAELFQLARTNLYISLDALLEQAQKQFPSETPERLRECAKQLGLLLKQTDHGGYGKDYDRISRHRKKAASRNLPASKG
jgi:NADH:ubiquinone oxidoreductase subunit E